MDLSHIDNATNWMENVMLWGKKWSAFHVCARQSELVIDSSLKKVCYADLSRTMKIKDLLCIQASQWIQIVHKHTPTSKCASKFLLHASQTDRMRPFEICERRTYMIHNDGLDWLRVTMNLCLAFHAMLYAISVHTYAEFCKNPYFFVYSTRGSFTLKMTKVVLTVKKPTKSIESKKIHPSLNGMLNKNQGKVQACEMMNIWLWFKQSEKLDSFP